MTTAMSKQEREAFLAEVRVGILSVPQPDLGPLAAPIWYDIRAGRRRFGPDRPRQPQGPSAGAGRAREPVRADRDPPVQVRHGRGAGGRHGRAGRRSATCAPWPSATWASEQGDQYAAAAASATMDSVLVRIRPEHWLTVDYGKAEPSGDGG